MPLMNNNAAVSLAQRLLKTFCLQIFSYWLSIEANVKAMFCFYTMLGWPWDVQAFTCITSSRPTQLTNVKCRINFGIPPSRVSNW
jgi:uncharacterized membrane protein YccF (DUF307 family)